MEMAAAAAGGCAQFLSMLNQVADKGDGKSGGEADGDRDGEGTVGAVVHNEVNAIDDGSFFDFLESI